VPNACLAIVGDGPHRRHLERCFSHVDCRFLGYLKGEELAEAYASADAFLYASEIETLGNVLLEAMASGLPVVAPRAGGIPSFVQHQETGLLFTPRDFDEAVRLVQQIDADDALRNRLGNAARQLVSEWDWTNSIQRVRDIYVQTATQAKSYQKVIHSNRVAKGIISGLVSAFRVWPRPRVGKPQHATTS
ncbi:MAG: glycosyltransferase, partial [Planctomycetaceae bacterium]|nr:glycosyltransferase [Planctomycetaceae bacterium]